MSETVVHVAPGHHQRFQPQPGVTLCLLHGAPQYQAFLLEVEPGLPFSTVDVARLIEATLADQRGWATRHKLVGSAARSGDRLGHAA